MKQEHFNWLKERRHYMYVSVKMQPGEPEYLYEIYNTITGEHKKPNGCGSCLRNTIAVIRKAFEEQEVIEANKPKPKTKTKKDGSI